MLYLLAIIGARRYSMRKLFYVTLVAFCTLNAAEVKKCVEYNPKEFLLEQYIYSADKKRGERASLEKLKIYYFYKDGKLTQATLEYTANGHRFFNPYIYCDKYLGRTLYSCSFECDGGTFDVDKNHAIRLERLAIYQDDANTENGGVKELLRKDKKSFINGKDIKCPQDIPQGIEVDKKYYKDTPKGLFVCYDWRHKGKYKGCFRSQKSCKTLHRQHFGKYLSQSESKEAFERCKRSTPNSKFIDNREGLYVCYDYKNSFGEYSGCFRSKLSCKSIHKKHFGLYPNRHESYRAFLRCSASAPRK